MLSGVVYVFSWVSILVYLRIYKCSSLEVFAPLKGGIYSSFES